MGFSRLLEAFSGMNLYLFLVKLDSFSISSALQNWLPVFLNHLRMRVGVTDEISPCPIRLRGSNNFGIIVILNLRKGAFHLQTT